MGFRPIKHNSGEGMAKIKILDENGTLLENWTIMMSDLGRWADMMRKKYGIKNKEDRDLDWAIK